MSDFTTGLQGNGWNACTSPMARMAGLALVQSTVLMAIMCNGICGTNAGGTDQVGGDGCCYLGGAKEAGGGLVGSAPARKTALLLKLPNRVVALADDRHDAAVRLVMISLVS